MNFITGWYYDCHPDAIRSLKEQLGAAGVDTSSWLGRPNFSWEMRIAKDSIGELRLLFRHTDPAVIPSLIRLRTEAVPMAWLDTFPLREPDSPLTIAWRGIRPGFADSIAEANFISGKPIPDVSYPIEVDGETYHRLALTRWHNHFGSSRDEYLVVALQDTPNIRAAVPLAKAMAYAYGTRVIILTDDISNYEKPMYGLGRSGNIAAIPNVNLTSMMATVLSNDSLLELSVASLTSKADIFELPSGGFIPTEILQVERSGRRGGHSTLGDKMLNYIRNYNLSRLFYGTAGGVTLMGRSGPNGHGNRYRLYLKHDQEMPDLQPLIERLDGALRSCNPTLSPEDTAAVERYYFTDRVRELLELPKRRIARRVTEARRKLDDYLAHVATWSKTWTEAAAAEQMLAGGISDEKVKVTTESIIRANKIASIAIHNEVIDVTTTMIYAKDTRTGAWHEMGKYRIIIDTENLDIRYENLTRSVDNAYFSVHPHIDKNGRACVGNFSAISSQLVAANDWLGLVEMCVVFLSNANASDPAGCYVHYWPFVAKPEEVGLPAYTRRVIPKESPNTERWARERGEEPPTAAAGTPEPEHDADADRVAYDRRFEEEGEEPRCFEDILDNPVDGDRLMLLSAHTGRLEEFEYDAGYDDWYDGDGYDVDGYNVDGYNRDGYNRDGYNRDGQPEEQEVA